MAGVKMGIASGDNSRTVVWLRKAGAGPTPLDTETPDIEVDAADLQIGIGDDPAHPAFDAIAPWHQDPLECKGLLFAGIPIKREIPSPTPGDVAGPRDVKPLLLTEPSPATACDFNGVSAAQPDDSEARHQAFEERLGLDATQLVVMNTAAETDAEVDVDEDDGDSQEPVTKVCEDCGLTYMPRPDQRLSHRCKRSFRCKTCSWTARSLDQLRAHEMQEHESRKPFECAECKKRFTSAYSLRTHLRMHAKGSSTCACPGCGANFDTSRNLVAHQKQCRAFQENPKLANNRPVLCTVCYATFWTRTDVRRHAAQTHTMVHQHKCTKCVASFKTKFGLRHHLKVHRPSSSDFAYRCATCKAHFSGENELIEHLNRHLADAAPKMADVKGELAEDVKGKRHGLRQKMVKPDRD